MQQGILATPGHARPFAFPGNRTRSVWKDHAFYWLCQGAAVFVIILAALLATVLLIQSLPSIRETGLGFFTSTTWDPEPTHRLFGSLAFIYGTVATSAIAMVIAVPFGVATALYLSECAPGIVRRVGASLVEMLAAVPSIVYGFWGLFFFAPIMQDIFSALGGPNSGVGIVPAGIILAIMIVPYITSISYDVFRAVPKSQRDASYALGATRWRTIWSVVLPYGRIGIVGGGFIALGRALGETMAVTMLIGNRPDIEFSLFAKGNSIASVIANEFTEATYDLYLSALVELGLVLLIVSAAMSAFARLLIHRTGSGRPSILSQWIARWKRLHGSGLAKAPIAARPVARDFMATPLHAKRLHTDMRMTRVLTGSFAFTVMPLFLIIGYLFYEGVSSLDWNFFTKLPAPVGETGGGMANACYGSLLLVGLATLFALPVGLFAAIYLAEFRCDSLGNAVRFIGELLGSVPSIVIGIFGYTLLVKPMGHFSGWAGGFALGVMMIPIFMRATEGALRLVPVSIRDASDALGASRWQTTLKVVIPAALPALITALFLSIARVAGETAPLLLTASSNQYWPSSPNDFTPSLPVYIFNYAISPYEDWHRQAWAAALVLVVVIMLLNFGVRFISHKKQMNAGLIE